MTKLQSERYQCNRCPQVLKDLKSFQIHQFVDHQENNTSSPSRGPPPQQIRTVTAIPPPPPQQTVSMYPRSVMLPSIPAGIRTSFSHSHHAPAPSSVGNFSNGHINHQHGSMSREGSVSSDSGEGGPLSPPLKCELCGVTNFPSNKALQQVRFLIH